MAIYYNIFEPAERKAAFEQLINLIEEQEYHLDVGVLGGRVLFHVLTEFGYSDLAFSMITRPDYPSYGNWIARGATTLWEVFQPEGSDRIGSPFLGRHQQLVYAGALRYPHGAAR